MLRRGEAGFGRLLPGAREKPRADDKGHGIRQFRFKPFDGWRQTMVEGKKGQPVYKRPTAPKPWHGGQIATVSNITGRSSTKLGGVGNYEKGNQGNLLHSLDAFFLMSRLLMKCVDEDMLRQNDLRCSSFAARLMKRGRYCSTIARGERACARKSLPSHCRGPEEANYSVQETLTSPVCEKG